MFTHTGVHCLAQKGGLNQQKLTGVKPHVCLECGNRFTRTGK